MQSALKVRAARALKQLEFIFGGGTRSPSALLKIYAPSAPELASPSEAARRDSDSLTLGEHSRPASARERKSIHLKKRDRALESHACELLQSLGANRLAREVRVEWNPRLKSAAGRADFQEKLISLNPLLRDLNNGLVRTEFGTDKLDCLKQSSLTSAGRVVSQRTDQHAVVHDEVERTLRHELAHLLAQWRVGRRRIAPHGKEWRKACRDLGIADEARCHNLPFTAKTYSPRYIYRCPNCQEQFSRVRRIRRAIACLACCRKHNGGDFDPRFRLKRIK